ncbi:MAG TPA: ribokinase, partial [Chloroflexota bacterium]
MTASRLGLLAGILTSAGKEIPWADHLGGVEIIRRPSGASTSFENLYQAGRRVQRLLSVAEPVSMSDLPGGWHDAPIVHLGPVAHEITGEFGRLFPGALLGLTAQGFLRTWGDGSVVQPGRWSGDDALLDSCDVVFFSEEDLRG